MIIVTGGAGFIGSNIVKELNRRGRTDILIVDDLKDGQNYKNLRGLQFIDYQYKDDFLQSIEDDDFDGTDIDAVFHEGACSDTMEYDVNFMMRTNYEYSKSLLHFCLQHRIPFMYASSASTYGGGKNGFREGDECEDALNPYAFSKLAFDRYVRQVMPEAHSQIVGLKCDFVYVKDVVRVNLWFWENHGPSGIYNCGTGHAHSYNEVAKAVIKAMGKGEIAYRDFPEVLKGKYQNFTESDPTHLLAAGYDQGFTDMDEAVKEYVTFLDNGGYYEYGK